MRALACLATAALAACATPALAPEGPARPRALGSAPPARVASVRALVAAAAARHAVPEALVLGVIQVESSFDPTARSSAGATGLMQLMPRTAVSLAARLGREDYALDDPAFNIEAGTYYLAYLLRLFGGDHALALAAYNTGPMRVRRWQREGTELPAYSRRYVAAVLAARDRFARGEAPASRPAEAHPELDGDGLRALLRRQQARYGERPDEALPAEAAPASRPAGV
jgi:soluble lytic murein transglycosylase